MKTVISNDPAPIGERCFLCEEPLTPPWFKTGKFRMHTACRDLVREDFEAKHRRRLINPKTEPPRVCRRLFGLSYAAMAACSSMA